jgi:putative ABC transport system permease protein
VAVLGIAAARSLGVGPLERRPAVFVGGVPLTVIGVLADLKRRPDLLQAVIVPRGTAERIWGRPGPGEQPEMIIETELGAAQQVASQVPLALHPEAPDRVQAVAPPSPRALRTQITGDLNGLFLLLAAVCLLIGTAGIANTTVVAVLERVNEIGLRRALGARPRHIAAQFLLESAALGTMGGLIGTSLGVVTTVGTAVAMHWTPLLQPSAVIPAPLTGTLAGLAAGIYPAWRAARTEPLEALRR